MALKVNKDFKSALIASNVFQEFTTRTLKQCIKIFTLQRGLTSLYGGILCFTFRTKF